MEISMDGNKIMIHGGVRLYREEVKFTGIAVNPDTKQVKFVVDFKNGTKAAFDKSESGALLSSKFIVASNGNDEFNSTYASGLMGLELKGTAKKDVINIENSIISDIDVTGGGKSDEVYVKNSKSDFTRGAVISDSNQGLVRVDKNDAVYLENNQGITESKQ